MPCRLPVSLVLVIFVLSQNSLCQSEGQAPSPQVSRITQKVKDTKGNSTNEHRALSITDTIKLTGVDIGMLAGMPTCDADGNFYLRNDVDLHSPIHKLSLKGEKKADFLPASSIDLPNLPPELAHADKFWVTDDGELYLEVMVSWNEHDFLLFGKDGTYKSKVELDNAALWHVSTFAVFPSGEFLITGDMWQKLEQNYAPFTAIFSSRGTFLKKLSLEDDEKIYQYTVNKDSDFVNQYGKNRAIDKGEMKAAADGNIYLMRWLSPAVIYAISPGGEVVRRFTVSPDQSGMMPSNMRVAGDTIAIEFRNSATKKHVIKVVDLEGRERASYDFPVLDGKPLWVSVCYLENPERFVFLDQAKDDSPVLRIAEPR